MHIYRYFLQLLYLCNMALYGDLLDIFAKYEDDPNIAEMIFCTIKELYPRIEISRPSRVLDSVRRIVAPTRQSARGDAKIVGLSLETYRKKVWEPRIRTPGICRQYQYYIAGP